MTREKFLTLIGNVRGNGAFPDQPLLDIYDQLNVSIEELAGHVDALVKDIDVMDKLMSEAAKVIREQHQQIAESQSRILTKIPSTLMKDVLDRLPWGPKR